MCRADSRVEPNDGLPLTIEESHYQETHAPVRTSIPWLARYHNYCLVFPVAVGVIVFGIWNMVVRNTILFSEGPAVGGLPWFVMNAELGMTIAVISQFILYLIPAKKRKSLVLSHSNPDESLPRVDVLLPMCGEELSIQQETIRSAANMDYPNDKLKIFVLDDASDEDLRDWFETWAEEANGPTVNYLSREKKPGQPHFAKAGNLNYVIHESSKEPQVAEYICVFDADMMPVKSFVRKSLPHFLVDEGDRLAMTITPQRYYNLPNGDPLAQDGRVILEFFMPRLDTLGVAFCLGSGFTVRRSSLCDIGGIPTSTTSEDVNTSFHFVQEGVVDGLPARRPPNWTSARFASRPYQTEIALVSWKYRSLVEP
jgi:hypothetical protein